MYFQKSRFLLLTTAALTSIATASRPSSATPVNTLDADVDIVQRDVNHKPVNEPIYNVVKADLWADEKHIQQDAPVLVVAHHDAVDVNAKFKNNVVKRAAVSVSTTTTKYNTKTLTTNVADPTMKLKEESVDSHQAKSKGNADFQSQQLAEPLVNAYSTATAKEPPSSPAHHSTAKMTKTPPAKDVETSTKTKVKTLTTGTSDSPVGKPTSKPDTKSRSSPIDKATSSPAPAHSKQTLTSFELSSSTSSPTSSPTSPSPSTSQPTQLSNTIVVLSPPNSPTPQSLQTTHSNTNTATATGTSTGPKLPKRSPGTFEYIYDTTTVLVTPTLPPPAQHFRTTGTSKLRFGVLALSPTTTKKAHS